MRFKVVVSYDGTNFNGFQKQRNYRSVEEELEKALLKMHKYGVRITGAGRTDKGVHAKHQVFHFDTNLNINAIGNKKSKYFIAILSSSPSTHPS